MAQTITIQLMRRLMIAAILGASAAAGLTATITTSPAPANATTLSTADTSTKTGSAAALGEAGAAAMPDAHASGITVSGTGRAAAIPMVSATTGTRLATEARVELPGGLATISGVAVSAAVTRGHTAAHARIANASYSGHDLGPIAVHCRDGKPTPERRGVVRLAPNKIVEYGRIRGAQAVGATVLVLGPADRLIRMISIGTASCTAPAVPARNQPSSGTTYAPRPAPDEPTPATTQTAAPGTTTGTASKTRPNDDPAVCSASPASEHPGASGQRRLVPRAPAPTLRHAHPQVTR